MPAMYEAAQVGKRQEILDRIFNIADVSTPLMNMLRGGGKKPLQTTCEWLAEKFPDVASTGALDGAPAKGDKRVDRYSIEGVVHHFIRDYGVTKRANLTSIAGAASEKAHQRAWAIKILRQMMEQQFCSADDCALESGATPYTARGGFSWLDHEAQTVKPVNSAIRPSADVTVTTALASITENTIRDALEAAAEEKRGPVNLDGFVGQQLRAVLDDFTNVHPVSSSTSQPRTVYQVRNNSTFQLNVDTLVFSAGTVRLHNSFYLYRTTSNGAVTATTPKAGLLLDMSMWDIGFMQNVNVYDLPDDGSGPKGYADAFAVLRCYNPLGQVRVIPE